MPLELNADQKATALKDAAEIYHAAQFLHQQIDKGDLEEPSRSSILSVIEYTVASISKTLGYDGELRRQIDERHADLRKANMRIHELEARLGAQAAPALLQFGLKSTSDIIKEWWRTEGFGHVSELNFTDHGFIQLKLSCHLSGHAWSGSTRPVTETEEKTERIRQKASRFEIVSEEPGGYHHYVVDTQANRAGIIDMIKERFPSAVVHEFKNHSAYKREGVFVLRDVRVMIYDLQDIGGDDNKGASNGAE